MSRFSERMGFRDPPIALRDEEVSTGLRNKVWNVMFEHYFRSIRSTSRSTQTEYDYEFRRLCENLENYFFKRPVDEINKSPERQRDLYKKWFLDSAFPDFYDFVEYISGIQLVSPIASRVGGYNERREIFCRKCNIVFSEELAPFRFVSGELTKIVDESERESIETAINSGSGYVGSKQHLRRALQLFSQRPTPDYRNCIKEAISAVESICAHIVGQRKATLSTALKEIEKTHSIHSALREGFNKIYGYTSDEGGIRHAMLEGDNVTEKDARFMLVSCSAFVNYLTMLHEEG